jgi:hypothetical protein
MIRLYIGGIIIAGSFAILAPGRYLHTLFFNKNIKTAKEFIYSIQPFNFLIVTYSIIAL